MADRIELKGVSVFGHHGVLPEEKASGQLFFVDVVCWFDQRSAAASDDVTDTVNYAAIAETVEKIVAGPPRNLIETVAANIVETIMSQWPQLLAAEVTVHKPQAPIPVPFTDVAVVARRSRR